MIWSLFGNIICTKLYDLKLFNFINFFPLRIKSMYESSWRHFMAVNLFSILYTCSTAALPADDLVDCDQAPFKKVHPQFYLISTSISDVPKCMRINHPIKTPVAIGQTLGQKRRTLFTIVHHQQCCHCC